MAKKYLSLERLEEYTDLMLAEIAEGDESAKSHADAAVTKLTDGTTKVASATHADSATTANSATTATTATTASKLGSSTVGSTNQPIYLNQGAATKVTSVGVAYGGTGATDAAGARTNLGVYSATEVDTKLSGKASTSHNHDSAYDTKGSAASALSSAKTYADSAAATVKNDLLNGAGAAYDTLKELGDLIVDNADAIEALETIASGKADNKDMTGATSDAAGAHGLVPAPAAGNQGKFLRGDGAWATPTNTTYGAAGSSLGLVKSGGDVTISNGVITVNDDSHNHTIANVDGLQTALDGKQAAGSYAAASHTHDDRYYTETEIDTKLANKANTTHSHGDATTSAAGFMTAAMVTKLNGIATGATKITVDTALSSSSANPVQNKVVNSALSTLTSTVSTNTSSISSHNTAISNLQTAVSEIQEITSAEISALFA